MTDRIDEERRQETSAAPESTVVRPGPDRDEVTSPAPRRRIDTGNEWFWPVVNLVGLVAAVATYALANTVPFNDQTTGAVLDAHLVAVQPAGWTFAIWALIYVLLIAFVVYAFLPAGRGTPRVTRIAPLFLGVNIANVVWLISWHWEQWAIAAIAFVALVAALGMIYLRLRRGHVGRVQPPTAERLMVWTPFSVYLGWATVVLLASVAVWLDRAGVDLFGLDASWTAVVLLAAVVTLTALMSLWARDPTYALAVAWGVLGIAVEQWDRSKLVSFSAMVALVLIVALAVFGSLLAFELRLTGHVLPEPQVPRRRWRFGRDDPSEAREDGDRT